MSSICGRLSLALRVWLAFGPPQRPHRVPRSYLPPADTDEGDGLPAGKK